MSVGTSSKPKPLLDREKYFIGIVCALLREGIAVQSAFDHTFFEKHEKPTVILGDRNSYSFGTIGSHHVVLAHADDDKGNIKSAAMAGDMRRSFPNIKLCLLVGVCAILPFIPNEDEDSGLSTALLGDIVVSNVVKEHDLGKEYPYGFKTVELFPSNSVQERNEFARQKTPAQKRYLQDVLLRRYLLELDRHEDMRTWGYPGFAHDQLYQANYVHKHREPFAEGEMCTFCQSNMLCTTAIETTCKDLNCSQKNLISRDRLNRLEMMKDSPHDASENPPRCYRLYELKQRILDDILPQIFFGDLASGEKVLKSAELRDNLSKSHKVIGFEMEGVGVCYNFPTMVIKAAVDYGDSHKNKKWQKYACMTAAACAKAMLENLQMGIPSNVDHETEQQSTVPVKLTKASNDGRRQNRVTNYNTGNVTGSHFGVGNVYNS